MQALNRFVETIKVQLRELSLNARLLIGSLMVILVMALFLVSIYAGDRQMTALNLPPDLNPEAKARAIHFLKTRDIPFKEQGADIMVPAEQRTIVLAQLVDYQLLAGDQIDFDQIVKDENVFASRQQNDRKFLIAKMNELESMIREFRGIRSARVVIDPANQSKGIGASRIPASASVTVSTDGRGLTQKQADTIAGLVAGAQAGLKVEQVRVTDSSTGMLYQARGEDSRSSMRNLEAKLTAEKHAQEKIVNALASWIPGVRVNVNVQMDTRDIMKQITSYEEPLLGMTEESTRNINSSRRPAMAEPGMRTNTGASLAGSGRTSETFTDERADASTIPFVGTTNQQIRDPKGQAQLINATIGVPRSYFVNVYMATQPDAADEPDEATIGQVVQDESEKIRTYIEPLIDTRAVDGAIAGVVTVTMFHDVAIGGFGPAGTPGSDGGSGGGTGFGGTGIDEGLMKYVGLSGLALISLAMMFLMVRKATTHVELPSAEELVGIPPALSDADSGLIGEAEETAPALEGIEIDEGQIKRQEMLEQIKIMVRDSPDEAAHLMRKWISEGDH